MRIWRGLLGLAAALALGFGAHAQDLQGAPGVTSVATGSGLTGGPITDQGTLALAPIATDTVLGNTSGSSAAPSAEAVPSCTGALTYALSGGFGCNSGLAPLASPTFTGTPAGPTAANGTNTTQLATTAFVQSIFGLTHTWALAQTFTTAPVFTDQAGSRSALALGSAATASTGTSGGVLCLLSANCTVSGAWSLASPTLSGTKTTDITGAIQCLHVSSAGVITGTGTDCGSGSGAVGTTGSPASGNLAKFSGSATITNADLTGDVTTAGGVATTIAANAVTNAKSAQATANTMRGNVTGSTANVTDVAMPSCSTTGSALNYTSGTGPGCATGLAPLASPALTGTPTAPTPTAGDNTTKIATTAFGVANFAPLAGPIVNQQNAGYTLVLSDCGKVIQHFSASGHTYTIPANASVAMPVGCVVKFENGCNGGAITLAITTDTLNWLPTVTTGTRTLASCSVATLEKLTSNVWYITGFGVSWNALRRPAWLRPPANDNAPDAGAERLFG